MYMRLWWKDARQFWPIWVFLILAAAVTQVLVLHYTDQSMRRVSTLVIVALCWATLYAYAVGAAAFAGERETGTLRLLDILPVSRWVVWTSKVSFAVVTTLGLAATFLLIAAMGSGDWAWPWQGFYAYRDTFWMAGVMLQALAFGLLCSSILNTALLAALSAMALTALSWTGVMFTLDHYFEGSRYNPGRFLVGQVVIVLSAVLASLIAFTWTRRTRRVPIRLGLRSPIVVSWDGSSRANPRSGARAARTNLPR